VATLERVAAPRIELLARAGDRLPWREWIGPACSREGARAGDECSVRGAL